MSNATEFLKRYRLKSIDTLFFTMYSTWQRQLNNKTSSVSSLLPSGDKNGGGTGTRTVDDDSNSDYRPLRPWQTDSLEFLCTTLVPLAFAVVIVIALTGNLIVIYVILRQQKLRTPLNVYFVSLAFSDVTMVVIGLPFTAYGYAADSWLIGDVICRVHNYANMTSIFVSIYTMVAVATYRCRLMLITSSRRDAVSQATTVRQSVVCVSVIWAIMVTVNLPILLLYTVKSKPIFAWPADPNENYLSCELTHAEYGRDLFLAFFILGYVLPLSVALTCYVVIIVLLRRQVRQSLVEGAVRGARKRNVRVTSLLVIILLTFTLCWLPLHIQLLYAFSGDERARSYEQEVFRVLTFCLAYSSTAINPILYSFACTDFRQGCSQVALSVVSRLACCWGPGACLKRQQRIAIANSGPEIETLTLRMRTGAVNC